MGADWAEPSHQRAIVNGTEGLCAHLTLSSLMRLLPAEGWLLEDCEAAEGATGVPKLWRGRIRGEGWLEEQRQHRT